MKNLVLSLTMGSLLIASSMAIADVQGATLSRNPGNFIDQRVPACPFAPKGEAVSPLDRDSAGTLTVDATGKLHYGTGGRRVQ